MEQFCNVTLEALESGSGMSRIVANVMRLSSSWHISPIT